jgi:hypothetical protein
MVADALAVIEESGACELPIRTRLGDAAVATNPFDKTK